MNITEKEIPTTAREYTVEEYKWGIARIGLVSVHPSVGKFILINLSLPYYIVLSNLFMIVLTITTIKPKDFVSQTVRLFTISKNIKLFFVAGTSFTFGSLFSTKAVELLPIHIVSSFGYGFYTLCVLFLSSFILKEMLPSGWKFYVPVTLVGLYLVTTKGNFSLEGVNLEGMLYLIAYGSVYAVQAIYAKRVVEISSTQVMAFWNGIYMLALTFAIYGVYSTQLNWGGVIDVVKEHKLGLGLLLVSCVMSYGLLYLNMKSYEAVGVARSTILTSLGTACATFVGAFLFGYTLSIFEIVGIIFITYSVGKMTFMKTKQQEEGEVKNEHS